MQHFSLAIAGLLDEFQRLRRGGCYWLACDRATEAEAACRTVLGGLEGRTRAALVALGAAPTDVLEPLAAGVGPGELTAFHVPASRASAAFLHLERELDRALRPLPPLVVVLAPASGINGLSDARLRERMERLQTWARQRGTTLLVASHDEAAGLVQRLLPLSDRLSGLAQAYADGAGPRLLLHYWMNDLGVYSLREFVLAREADGRLSLRAEAAVAADFESGAHDQRLYLAQADVLEGAPALSPGWHLFDDAQALVGRAVHAQAANVLFSIHGNSQVESLANVFFRLRRERGNALKLVVREMAPCLRYADERLLLDCGASLIAPYGTPLARFLTLLESVQGLAWQGTLPDDPARLMQRYRPPSVGGVVAPAEFRRLVKGIGYGPAGRIEHVLLTLQPVDSLDAAQALSQCALRRQGDLACTQDGRICLFLFACRRDAVEQALDNLFRLPWRELFIDYQFMSEYDLDLLTSDKLVKPGADTAEGIARTGTATSASLPPVLEPRPIRLDTVESA